jgi:hypothetical protein
MASGRDFISTSLQARLATTLIHEMARTGASRGIASLCVDASCM